VFMALSSFLEFSLRVILSKITQGGQAFSLYQ